MATQREKQLAIKLLTERLERLSGKKVMLKEAIKLNDLGDYLEIEFPNGFKDEFVKSKKINNLLYTDTIIDNKHYNQLITTLKKYNLPYKERKARIDNSVRIEISLNNL